MPEPAIRLDHLAFPSFDVAATHHFYGRVLGLPLIAAHSGKSDGWGGREYVMMVYGLRAGGHIAFFSMPGIERPADDGLPIDIRHAALTATSARQLAAWKRRLRRNRVSFWEEVHGEQRSIYFSDPNGVVLEINFPDSADTFERDPSAARVVADWVAAHPARRRRRRRR